MNKLLLSCVTSLALSLASNHAAAQVSVNIHIPLPPPIVFSAPPSVVVLPETDVYVVPGVQEEIFFCNGWWWRPWGGRWYRSQHYGHGWVHYPSTPFFYHRVPRGWREDYHQHRWGRGAWNHSPISHDDLNRHWRNWQETKHWEHPQHRQHELHRDGRSYESHHVPEVRHDQGRHEGHVKEREVIRHEEPRRDHSEHDRGGKGREERGNREHGRKEREHR